MNAGIAHRNIPHLVFSTAVLAFALGLFTASGPAHAMHPEGVLKTTWDGVAIKGYDPVAYFTMGRAVKGSQELAYEWLKAKWQFANAEHRDRFAADPLKYAPQYGGYCSNVHIVNGNADINPTAWRIVKERLYLFYSEPKAAEWVQDESAVTESRAEWEQVKAGLGQ